MENKPATYTASLRLAIALLAITASAVTITGRVVGVHDGSGACI